MYIAKIAFVLFSLSLSHKPSTGNASGRLGGDLDVETLRAANSTKLCIFGEEPSGNGIMLFDVLPIRSFSDVCGGRNGDIQVEHRKILYESNINRMCEEIYFI